MFCAINVVIHCLISFSFLKNTLKDKSVFFFCYFLMTSLTLKYPLFTRVTSSNSNSKVHPLIDMM